MKKMLFVFNPRSGKARIRNKLSGILDIFTKAGYDIRVHVTQAPLDAKDWVQQYGNEADIVVCSGGDGTLNETISGLMELEKPPLLGYIPSGTTNDFASSMKLSKSMLKAAETIVNGKPFAFDVGCFAGRYFAYVAAFGAFTDVPYITPQEKKNMLGHQAYMLEGMKRLTSLRSYTMKVTYGDNVLEGDFIFGMVTNTISVGGFKGLVGDEVALNDGIFEALFVKRPKTPAELAAIFSYLIMKEEESDYVYCFKTNALHVESEESVDWVLDGEYGGSITEVNITNKREALLLLQDKR